MKENTDHKVNSHLPYHAFAFYWMEPLLQAEVLSKRSGCNPGRRQDATGPPWPACSMCWSEHDSTRQLHQKTRLQLASEPLGGSTLAVCYTSLPPSSFPISRVSSSLHHGCWPLGAGRWDRGSGSQAVTGNGMKLWASNLPRQKTYGLAQPVATETSHGSDSQNFPFVSEGAVGTLQWDAGAHYACCVDTPTASSLQVQEQQSPAVLDKDLPQGHTTGLENLLPLSFLSETVQSLC